MLVPPVSYPLAALVGQEQVLRALLLTAISPTIGGVLLRGEKGTAKSTAARGLADLLDNPNLFRTLPLSTTEDRLTGGLDFTQTIATGKPVFSPGILAEVDGGVLYVDEVNLLDDHLVDTVLDAAASGTNRVEREGFSLIEPARFVLIGSMNPEEGSLRPQLLDRFGLCVDVAADVSIDNRVELLRRRKQFDEDPSAFVARWREEQERLKQRLTSARAIVPRVRLSDALLTTISEISLAANVAGHRADLVMAAAAKAHAAWDLRTQAQLSDVLAVTEFALCHRRRDAVPAQDHQDSPPSSSNQQNDPEPDTRAEPDSGDQQDTLPESDSRAESLSQSSSDRSGLVGPDGSDGGIDPTLRDSAESSPDSDDNDSGSSDDSLDLPLDLPSEPFRVRRIEPADDRLARRGSGRRQRTRSADRRGRYVLSRAANGSSDVALDATLRAAAPFQRQRQARWRASHDGPAPKILVESSDWQMKVRERRIGTCIIFLVDASGSMGARGRMAASKGAVLSLLLDAYQKRDRVALVSFRRREAEVLLPPTNSVEEASRLLSTMQVGGRTPLTAGLAKTQVLLRNLLLKQPLLRPLVILVSDGRANAPLDPASDTPIEEALSLASQLAQDTRVSWIVVDTEDTSGIRLKLAQRIANALNAPCFTINNLRADDLVGLVKGVTP